MSRITVDEISSTTNGGNIIINDSTKGAAGSVLQMKTIRIDARVTYTASNTGNGTTVTDLNLTITPEFSDSLILMTYMINGEPHHNVIWLMHQNGSLITTSGYEGYNNIRGNTRYSGFSPSRYDRNDSTTPTNLFFQYAVIAGSTATRTYAPAVRSSNSSNYTLYLNRTVDSIGLDPHRENMISTGTIMEIAQ